MSKTVEQLIESFKIEHPNITLKEQLSDYDKERILDWPSIECPFFTDEEIEDLKDYYSESGTESYHDYFDETVLSFNNKKVTHNKSYGERIIELQNKLKTENNPEEIDKIKQNLVDLGWNPEIEYTAESQAMARKRFIGLNSELLPKINILDARSFVESIDYSNINEVNTEKQYSVSVVLIRGNKIHSGVIAKITKCEYSHAAIALDGDFTKLYSFGVNEINKGGGFTIESVKRYPQNNSLAVYSFFVDKKDRDKLSDRFQEYLLNIKNTNFSRIGLVTFPFKHIDFTTPEKMVCSQFVDSCLKFINVDLTKSKSSKVSPAMLYSTLGANVNVYKVYEGKAKDFDEKSINSILDKLSISSNKINESKMYEFIFSEARKAGIEIKNNGDVLLTNPFIDFDSEYMSSHKLLIQYDESNNIEGMKYELARLYYMNYILEKKLYHNKFLINKEKNMKTRARVLNDFNKYIKIVLKKEPEFNFGKYYEASQFYPHTIEVKSSTVNAVKDIFRYIL